MRRRRSPVAVRSGPIVRCRRSHGRPGRMACRLEESVPEIRPFRALAVRPSDGRRSGARRRAAVRRHRPGRAARSSARHPANVVRLDLPASRRPATSPTTATGARPDARRLALRRDAAQGPAPVRLRLRADLPRARDRRGADPARVLRRLRLEPFGPGRASCRTSGRSPAPARTATSCSARPASTPARSSRCTTTRRTDGARPGVAAARPADARRRRRRRRPPSPVGVPADGRGRPRRVARTARGRRRARSPSPTATIATRPRCATATSGG